MSAPSPVSAAVDLITFAVVANGKDVSGAYQVLSIEVDKGAFRVARAKVTLRDGSPADESFTASASADFAPGNPLVIQAGYSGTTTPIFQGVVWGQRLRILDRETPVLVLDCRDMAATATVRRRFVCLSNQTDADAIRACLADHGLSVDVPGSSTVHPCLMQWDATDWDFAMIRSQVNGWIAYAEDGKVTVQEPDLDAEPALGVTFGDDVLDFDLRLDALSQIGSAEADAWNPSNQQVSTSTANARNSNPLGSDSSASLAAAVSSDPLPLRSAAALEDSELSAFAKAAIAWGELAKITGTLRFQGSPLARPGGIIEIDGLGKRFNGRGLIGGVRHEIREGNWTTEVRLGLDPDWFATLPAISGPSATGLVAPLRGLQIGVVKAITQDPASSYRVQVEVPLLASDTKTVWARLANFYASQKFGDFFYPEIGDEVVLGFLNEDPRYPVILGSLYSSARPPALEPDEQNSQKAIVTRSGLRLVFDEEKKSILARTPAGNQALLDDDSQSIEIVDQTGNSLKMTTSGITLKSPGSITLTATQGITIKSETDQVSVNGTQGVSVKGLAVSITAEADLSASGNAGVSLTSPAITRIEGSLVTIN